MRRENSFSLRCNLTSGKRAAINCSTCPMNSVREGFDIAGYVTCSTPVRVGLIDGPGLRYDRRRHVLPHDHRRAWGDGLRRRISPRETERESARTGPVLDPARQGLLA